MQSPFFLLKKDLFAEMYHELSKENFFLRQAKQEIQLNKKNSIEFDETHKISH